VNFGKLVGYVLLSLVDALLPPAFLCCIAFLLVPPELFERLFPYVIGLAGVMFVSAILAGLVSVHRGGKPFPLTRGTYRLFTWALTWL
jgi:hypothetical protein